MDGWTLHMWTRHQKRESGQTCMYASPAHSHRKPSCFSRSHANVNTGRFGVEKCGQMSDGVSPLMSCRSTALAKKSSS